MVSFINPELTSYLRAVLNYSGDIFDEKDLLRVEELSLNSMSISDEYMPVNIDDLRYFENLRVLTLNNVFIEERGFDVLKSLNKLEEIKFVGCVFDNNKNFADLSIEKLSLNKCVFDNMDFIYNMNYLKELSLVGGIVDISKMSRFYLLKYLKIANCEIENIDNINLPLLEDLILDFSNVDDLKFVFKLKSLKTLSLSEEQIDTNMTIISDLTKNGVRVYENEIFRIGEGE